MKARKTNYSLIQKRVNEIHKNIKTESKPIIIIAELLDNGSYKVLENIKNGKQRQLKFENEVEFNKYLDTLEKCTVIIDDYLEKLDTDILDDTFKTMSVEELRIIAIDDESIETSEEEREKILINGIKKTINI